MRPGNNPQRAVLQGEIIQHPNGVADPVAAVVGDRSNVGMQRLQRVRVWIGGTRVQTAELELGTKNGFDVSEDLRHADDLLEHCALGDEIREATGSWLQPEL